MIGAATRFVPTQEIRDAVVGRELIVLDHLGIRPPERGHMRCPYPGHGGENDWRWDREKRRAYCTCAKSSSIFDVIMRSSSCDFEDSKLFAAEAIGRKDLICERESGNKRFKSDARSLLSPPADEWDDTLPISYLAFRLGVNREAVLMPTTAAVGWRHLPYFDVGGKPELVARPPGTVWETIDCNGRSHAHRIWVAPNGAGKANLGERDGKPRNVKKSALATKGDNTAGRAVIWGGTGAPWTILCEGVETGAAVAAAFREEIERGDAMVAAAGSAGGVEAFRPWPSAKCVTCAADRDEEFKSEGRPPSKTGEKAAAAFASRHSEIDVRITLPGLPGTKTDWLDIFVNGGANAVRAGILGSPIEMRFPPETKASLKEDLRDHLEEVRSLYPLPTIENASLRYGLSKQKKIRILKDSTDREGNVSTTVIASPMGVPARLRYLDATDTYGIRLVVEGMDGKPKALDIARQTFVTSRGSDLMSQLFAAGLRVEADGEKVILACLKAADPQKEIIVVRQPGWHRIEGIGVPVFVCPDGETIGLPDGIEVELNAAHRLGKNSARKGSFEEWKKAAAVAVSVPNCQHWVLGVAAGFAGVIVDLTGLDTCGATMSGKTSAGKTTAQRLAASAFSNPEAGGEGLFQSARTTANGIESTASRANGTVLILDELSHVPGRELGKMIYTISGNIGRTRLSADAMPKPRYQWRTFALLSAERSVAEIIRSDGGNLAPGMAVRIIDIDVTGVDRRVPAAIIDEIKRVKDSYGHAGPAFVRALHESGVTADVHSLRQKIYEVARTLVGGQSDSSVERAALPLAVLRVAGHLAREFSLLPPETNIDGAIEWAWKNFRGSAECQSLDTDSMVVQNIQSWLLKHWGSSIHNIYDDSSVREILGWFDACLSA
jgi:hypothetical protein